MPIVKENAQRSACVLASENLLKQQCSICGAKQRTFERNLQEAHAIALVSRYCKLEDPSEMCPVEQSDYAIV